jgi:hypothetical protein
MGRKQTSARSPIGPDVDDCQVIVTKVGAIRGDDGSWLPAQQPAELERGVHDTLSDDVLAQLDAL